MVVMTIVNAQNRVGTIEGVFIIKTSWERAVEEARVRNAMG
jgi:hypothetical protein